MNTQPNSDAPQGIAHDSMPDDLSSSEAKLVYLYLTVSGGCTAERLHRDLGLGRLSLFPTLDVLAERDLVDRHGDRYHVSS